MPSRTVNIYVFGVFLLYYSNYSYFLFVLKLFQAKEGEKALGAQVKRTSANPLGDDRFSKMFTSEDFEVIKSPSLSSPPSPPPPLPSPPSLLPLPSLSSPTPLLCYNKTGMNECDVPLLH